MFNSKTATLSVSFAILFFLTGETANTGNPEKGKAIFLKNCSLCHGPTGSGLGPTTHMPNFTDKKYGDSHTPQQMFDKITRGVEGTGMPAWEKTLSPQDRWDVISYILTLGK